LTMRGVCLWVAVAQDRFISEVQDGRLRTAPHIDTAVPMTSFSSVEDIIEKYVPEKEREQVFRVMHGKGSKALKVPAAIANKADALNFQVKLEDMTQNAVKEQLRPPRKVRVATIQTQVPLMPNNGTVKQQFDAIMDRYAEMIDAAGALGVNVLGLQEIWTAPFFVATREKYPWVEFAEDPRTGRSTQLCKEKAAKWGMVIVSSILERDEVHSDRLWNTAVVIGHTGNYLGKHRKNHIPRVGDFNEATYYVEGDNGHPVFETAYGRIGINICYGRHHPMNWMMFGLNGAEIVFNPSATIGALSEPMWPVEGRAAAIFFSFFTVNTNRIGTELYPNDFTSGNGLPAQNGFGHFYGSSYVAGPDAARTPPLSRVRDGILATDIDLNQVRQQKDIWMLAITGRYDMYAKKLGEYVKPSFKPERIVDPALKDNAELGANGNPPYSTLSDGTPEL